MTGTSLRRRPSPQLPTATYRFPQQALKSHTPTTFSFPTSHFAVSGPLGPKCGNQWESAGGGTLLVTGTSLHRRAKRIDHPPPQVTVHALGTASRNAGGVSRHPSNIPLPLTGLKEPYPYYVLFSHFALHSFRPIRPKMR